MNWDLNSSVTVPIPAEVRLKVGRQYEVRDAMNYFGSPIASGVFNGSDIVIPMTGLIAASPVGQVPFAPVHTAPEFGAFVLTGK